MLYLTGNKLKQFMQEETKEIKHPRYFVDLLISDYIQRKTTRRGILVTGLRSTGKTIGVFQAMLKHSSNKCFFLSPTSKGENIKQSFVLSELKKYEADVIFIDEYSWIIEDSDESLADYLVGKAIEGVKVFIAGADSAKIHSLINTEFIHRAHIINTTYFPYDEYCYLYNKSQNSDTMKEYLTSGGIFENHINKSFKSMQDYIKTAIIDNLASYYTEYSNDLIKACVYTCFYECVPNCYRVNNQLQIPVYNYDNNVLSYEEYLEDFGVNPSLVISPIVLKEITNKLQEIGVVVKIQDLRIKSQERAYITNQTISYQLTKTIFALDKLPNRYIGYLYEASVVCYQYMKMVYPLNSRYEMRFLHGRNFGTDYEIDFIILDDKNAYLFDCKYNDNNDIQIRDNSSLVKDIIPNLLGDYNICGRFVIYQGEEKLIEANGKKIICTNNWDIDFESFDKLVEKI